MTVLSSWIGGINHVHLPTLSPWRRPAKVVNRPIATGTRMEILATEHTYRRGATPTSGGARSRAHVRTVRECTRTDERPNVFYCSADTRIWRGEGGASYRQTCTIGHSYTVINHRFPRQCSTPSLPNGVETVRRRAATPSLCVPDMHLYEIFFFSEQCSSVLFFLSWNANERDRSNNIYGDFIIAFIHFFDVRLIFFLLFLYF